MVLGEPLSEYEFKLLLEEANCENDGTIDYIKLSEKIFGEKYSKIRPCIVLCAQYRACFFLRLSNVCKL